MRLPLSPNAARWQFWVGWGIDWSPAYGPDEEAKMTTDREIALEVVIAALLKAARHDKNEILERAKGLVVDGAIGDFHSKSAANAALREISGHLNPSLFNAQYDERAKSISH